MDTCHYENVKTKAEIEDTDDTISRKYFLRQILVCSGIWSINFCHGLSFGSPTVFIPQIRQEANTSSAVSVEMTSWLSSTMNYSAIMSAVMLAVLARLIGRKLTFFFVCITSIIGYVLFYFSTSITQILISEIVHGPIVGTTLTVSTMVLTEYTSPRYRGLFLTIKAAIFLWGILVANAIGTFFHWKNIGILALMCSMYSLLTVMFWPESPYWLVTKSRFEDCALSFRWLKGNSRKSEAELEILIETRKTIRSVPVQKLNFFKSYAKMWTSITFYKPILFSMLVLALYHFSGKMTCGMYSIDIINRITGTTSSAYVGMLILDGVTVFGSYVGCGLSRTLKRRTMILMTSTIGVMFLYSITLYLYLIHFNIISEHAIISISLLIAYTLAISIGPMIMSTTILGELIPMKYRSSAVLFLSCFSNFIIGCINKISPFIITYFGPPGLFMFFAVQETLLIITTHKMLPETKDKTILEIQEGLLRTKSNIKSSNYPNEGK